jgi:hypothetical protein
MAVGVVFWVAEQDGRLTGVMGIQDKGDVALVLHAYVAPTRSRPLLSLPMHDGCRANLHSTRTGES